MIITCGTGEAAVQLLAMLIAAQLRIGLDYRVEPPDALGPPISFTFMTDLPATVLSQLRTIPHTTIT
jgi:hypothetical protein